MRRAEISRSHGSRANESFTPTALPSADGGAPRRACYRSSPSRFLAVRDWARRGNRARRDVSWGSARRLRVPASGLLACTAVPGRVPAARHARLAERVPRRNRSRRVRRRVDHFGRLRPFIAVLPAAGVDSKYDGEWAGPWEREIVDLVPFVDAHLSTVKAPAGRVLAGLSRGGFGAVYIALRHPISSARRVVERLLPSTTRRPVQADTKANCGPTIRGASSTTRAGWRFFLSTGPYHSHWIQPAETRTFARSLAAAGVRVRTFFYDRLKGEWRAQFDAGLTWALGRQ